MKNRSPVRSAQAIAPAALVCILSLLIPGSAALSQPFPSFMLDTSLAHMPGFYDLDATRVAFGPDTGLVVWDENSAVRGVRVDLNGTLLDTVPLEIYKSSSHPSLMGKPGIAWGGGTFLVAWTGYHTAGCATIGPDGEVTSRAAFQDSEVDGRGAEVAFDGTNFLVSWIAAPDTVGLTAFYARVSPQGAVLDSPPRLVAPLAVGRQRDEALCFHDDRYLVVWSDWDTIGLSGNFILPDGSIADSAGFHIRRGIITGPPAVTHDRSNFLVSWDEWADRFFVKLARVSDSGAVLDSAGVLIDSFSYEETEVVSNGDTTLFLYRRDPLYNNDSLTLVAVRVDGALNRLDAEPVKVSAPGYPGYGYAAEEYDAALWGNDYFVTWTQPLSRYPVEDFYQAFCRRVNLDGELLDSTPVVLSYGTDVQELPDAASDGDGFLAVWSDARHDSIGIAYSLLGARFTAEGKLLDSGPIWLDSSEHYVPPAVAFGGGCYLITWQDTVGIWAKRVTPAGLVLDSAPLHMPDANQTYPLTDVAFADSFFLIVWCAGPSLHGCRMMPSGALIDSTPLQLLVDQAHAPRLPQLSFDGTNFLVARHDNDDVQRCLRVGKDGAVLDTADITLGPTSPMYDHSAPEVAFGSGIYFVVDNVAGTCWRVSPEGYLLNSVPHADLGYTHVVFDGTDFMLLCGFRDTGGEWTGSLAAMRITPNGRILDSMPFILVAPDSAFASARYAAMALNAANRVGVVFECAEPSPYFTTRIRAATFPAIVGIGSRPEVVPVGAFRVTPNPASGSASLSFNLAQAGPVRVTAFDAAGRRCASLFSGRMKVGAQTLPLDTRCLANGVHFLRLEAEAATRSTRLVVAR